MWYFCMHHIIKHTGDLGLYFRLKDWGIVCTEFDSREISGCKAQHATVSHPFDDHTWQCLTLAFETTDSMCLAGVHDIQQQQQHWLCREQGQQPPHIQDQFCSEITFKVTNVCQRVSGQSFQSTKAPTLNSEFTNNLSSLTVMPWKYKIHFHSFKAFAY